MKYNTLGTDGPRVSAISIGSYHTYDRMEPEEIVEFLRAARAAGVNWFDVGHYVSAAYPDRPVSETDIRFGEARIAAGIAREDYFHTEKVWYGGPRPSFKDQLSASLPRAQVDYADCVIYNPDTAYYFKTGVDIEQIVRDMSELVETGLTRFWGINEALPSEIEHACDYAEKEGLRAPTVLQLPYSAVARRMVEDPEMQAVIQERDLGLQISNALAVGILAGRSAAASGRPLGDSGLTDHAGRVAADFEQRAESVDASPAQLAIAFALSNPQTSSVLFGASSVGQLEDNLGAVDLLDRLGTDGVRDLVADLAQNENELRVGQLSS